MATGSPEERVAELEAVIERVRGSVKGWRSGLTILAKVRRDAIFEILDASPSTVLAEHDHAVLVAYEETRKPDPIHIDNIDGLHAATWLAEHDAQVLEALAAEAATSFGWLDPDDAGRASRWIASRAAKRRKGAGQ